MPLIRRWWPRFRGDYYLSNAVLDGRYYLRACVVNSCTTDSDIVALPDYLVKIGSGIQLSES